MTNTKIFISKDQDNSVSEEYNDVFLEDGLPQATIIADYFSNEPQMVHAVNIRDTVIHYQEHTSFLDNWKGTIIIMVVLIISGMIITGLCYVH
jgi:hypothetical protein